MKKSILLAAVLFCSTILYAQNDLLVQSSEKGLYLHHTVVARENYYSIARLFNTTAKEIASFNGLDMNQGLMVGQMLKIPLASGNFTQTKPDGRPVYYVVGNGEGLYRVSVKNHNVQMANIRKWNQLSNDQIAAGQKLIIGYLVSPEANKINEPQETQVTVSANVPVKEEPKKEDVQAPRQIHDVPVQGPPKDNDNRSAAQVKTSVPTQVAVNDGNGGYFKAQFDMQVKSHPISAEQTASAGIFKTVSGWQDAKYYALMDGVEPGTIVRIVNPTNNKAVYAKVLGEMSGIRQNQGYDVRLSNAAASALQVSDTDKFIVRVVH